MNVDMATLSINVTTKGVEQAKKDIASLGTEGEKSAKKVETALGNIASGPKARETAKTYVDQLERTFQQDQARIRDGILRGFLNAQQARQAGAEAARAYNAGLVSAIDRTSAAGGFTGRAGQDAFAELTESMKKVEAQSGRTHVTINTLRSSLTSIAASALGAAPGVTQFSSALGALALGTVTTIGILAGIAAVIKGYELLTEGARKAREEQEKLLETAKRLDAQIKQGYGGETGAALTAVGRQGEQQLADIENLQKRIREAEANRYGAGSGFGPGVGGGGQGAVDALRKELAERQSTYKKTIELAQDLTDKLREIQKDYRKSQEDEAERIANAERRALLEPLRELEAQRGIWSAELEERTVALSKYSHSLKDLDATITPSITQNLGATIGGQINALRGTVRAAPVPTTNILGDLQRQAQLINESVQGAVQLAEAFGIVSRHIGDIIVGLGHAVAGYKPLQAALQTGNAGNIVGAALPVVGGIAQVIGGIESLLNSSKEAARQRAQQEKAFIDGLKRFNSTFAQQVDALQRSYEAQGFPVFQGYNKPVGISYSPDVTAARNAALSGIRSDFLADLARQFNALNGAAGELANKQAEIQKQYEANIEAIKALGLGEAELAKAEEIRARSLKELAQAEVDRLQGIIDSLKKFGDSLKLSGFSTLSPFAQLQTALEQYNRTRAAALSGDATAAGNLPEIAQAYLQALRAYYGSSSQYTQGFNGVQSDLQSIEDVFGEQKSVQEKILASTDAVVDEIKAGNSTLVLIRSDLKLLAERLAASRN